MLGDNVGEVVVLVIGALDGAFVAAFVGDLVGALVGDLVGACVGDLVGACVGDLVGAFVGDLVGAVVGDLVGSAAPNDILSNPTAPDTSLLKTIDLATPTNVAETKSNLFNCPSGSPTPCIKLFKIDPLASIPPVPPSPLYIENAGDKDTADA